MAATGRPLPRPELIWRRPLDAPLRPWDARLAVDRAGRTLAWAPDWESGPQVRLVDLDSGTELHRETAATLRLVPGGPAIFLLDVGWRASGPVAPRLLAIDCSGRGPVVTAIEQPARTQLVGVSPGGDRIVTFEPGRPGPVPAPAAARLTLRGWPSTVPLGSWRGSSPGVDWRAGCVWRSLPARSGAPWHAISLAALDGSWERPLPESRLVWHLSGVGAGVIRLGSHGVRVLRPRGPVVTVLPPTSRRLPPVRVDPTGRCVDVVLGGRPRRFHVDLDAGRVLDAPPDAPRLARARTRLTESAVWHPRRDLVAGRWRRRSLVATADGRLVYRLPDASYPAAWVDHDSSLLAIGADGRGVHLERWAMADLETDAADAADAPDAPVHGA